MTIVLVASLATMTASGLLMFAFQRTYHRLESVPRRLARTEPRRVDDADLRRLFLVNGAWSFLLLLGVPVVAFPLLFHERPVTGLRVVLEALAIVGLYDLLYYVFHRTLHHKRLMRYIHRVHHMARAPTAVESMYVHPVEFVAGILLLFLCVGAIGPVHVVSYVVALVPFQLVNVVIHSWLSFPAPLGLLDAWARGHHAHHGEDVNTNFGQFTHLWDHLFRTASR